MNIRKLMKTVYVIAILLAMTISTLPATIAQPTPYRTVEGVLATDRYALYPFEKDASLKIGFSKFGEMIDAVSEVGLEYRGVDPFAPPTTDVAKTRWINGWLINITYYYYQGGVYRTIWAGALFADTVKWGSPSGTDWLCVWEDTNNDLKEDFRDKGYPIGPNGAIDLTATPDYGGRKTNGTAITEPMKVLYNGPRKFVAVVSTTIYDHMDTPEHVDDVPLVKVVITIIFDKVKKCVILLKDVKSLLPWKTGDKLRIQFSNRGEVDLGIGESYATYAHFFVTKEGEGQPTDYNKHWEYVQTTDLGGEQPWATWGVDPTLDGTTPQPPTTGATYDVAQVINPDLELVFFAAFWPALSDWEMYGFPLWYTSLDADDPHSCDASDFPGLESEPIPVPFYIGEWDFVLDNDKGVYRHWRGVTVYGIVDWHDADDEDLGGTNVLDIEAKLWQLKQIFKPWDMARAVNPCKKETKRIVEFFTGNGSKSFELSYKPMVIATWEEYCTFAERVLVDGVLQIPKRAVYASYDYELVDGDGDGYYEINFTTPPPAGAVIKVLYSIAPVQEKVDSFEDLVVGETYNLRHAPIIDVKFVEGLAADGKWHKITDYTVNETKGTIVINENPPQYYEPGAWEEVKVVYNIYDGRYEWIVVGRDKRPDDPGARTPDVLAATYVAAALKNKNFETWYTGLDRKEVYGKMPFVMAKLTPDGDKWENYMDSIERPALKDDFCKYVPISSSNIVTVGGPLANLLTEYFNEFTDALFVRVERTEVPGLGNKILTVTCWSKNVYYANITAGELQVGYAVIAVHKDLNSTTGLIIWGTTGADTYWAAAWFHDHLLNLLPPDLQCIKPGVTAIVLKITYNNCIPTIDIVEVLGTISETKWPAETQEPWHPDP